MCDIVRDTNARPDTQRGTRVLHRAITCVSCNFDNGGCMNTTDTAQHATVVALIARSGRERVSVADVRLIARDIDADVCIVDERDRMYGYDMHVARMFPTWNGAVLIGMRCACVNDWDWEVDVYDRTTRYERGTRNYALINGRLYVRTARMRKMGGARVYDAH